MQSSARRKPEVGKIYNIRTSWGRGVTVQGKVIEFVRGGHHQKDGAEWCLTTLPTSMKLIRWTPHERDASRSVQFLLT